MGDQRQSLFPLPNFTASPVTPANQDLVAPLRSRIPHPNVDVRPSSHLDRYCQGERPVRVRRRVPPQGRVLEVIVLVTRPDSHRLLRRCVASALPGSTETFE